MTILQCTHGFDDIGAKHACDTASLAIAASFLSSVAKSRHPGQSAAIQVPFKNHSSEHHFFNAGRLQRQWAHGHPCRPCGQHAGHKHEGVYMRARACVCVCVYVYVHKNASMHARAQDHAITSAHMLCTCTHRLPVRPSLTLQLGPVSPFDASALVLTVGGVGIAMLWGENYGESRHQHSLSEQFQMAFAAIMSGALSCAGHFTSILVPCSVHYGCVLL